MARAISHMFKEKEDKKDRLSIRYVPPVIDTNITNDLICQEESPLIVKTFCILPKRQSKQNEELNKDLLPVNSKLGSLKHSSTNQLDSPSKIVDKSKIIHMKSTSFKQREGKHKLSNYRNLAKRLNPSRREGNMDLTKISDLSPAKSILK